MTALNISVTELNRVDLVTVEGAVNSETAPQFSAALTERLDHGTNNLVVDLQKVEFMSSAGLRALVSALKSARGKGGNVVLAAPSGRVKEVIELGGLAEVFTIFDEQVAAVGSF